MEQKYAVLQGVEDLGRDGGKVGDETTVSADCSQEAAHLLDLLWIFVLRDGFHFPWVWFKLPAVDNIALISKFSEAKL